MKRLSIIAMAAALAGCASSGPVATGKDTYMITKQSAGGLMVQGASVKTEILSEANAFCAKSGKSIYLIDSNYKNAIPFVRMSSAEIQFKCMAE